MSESLIVFMDPAFPLEDVEKIGRRLVATSCLVPGYIPAKVGFLDIRALVFSEKLEGISTIIIPDRNIASRMARMATKGVRQVRDTAIDVAIQLMAFAQAMNLDINPAIAFHELAHRNGNTLARSELAWFRAADRGNAHVWIDLALERTTVAILGPPDPIEPHDLAFPPERWNRNYIVAMKIVELARADAKPVERMITLLDWMVDDFILAGPAVMFAARYFATHSARGRMIKYVRSADQEKAVAGVRNAAWDITYLSEFVRLIPAGEASSRRYILATADQALAQIAPLLLLGPEPTEDSPSLCDALQSWWSPKDAHTIAERFFACVEQVGTGRRRGADSPGNPIADMIVEGERRMRAWRPKI